MKNSIEVWKDVPGYEGVYLVNNFGKVKSLPRLRKNKGGSLTYVPEKILTYKIDKDGYKITTLCRDGKLQSIASHRLEMLAFIPNPDNLPCVNHKDEDKTNNFIFCNEDGSVNKELSNLEWCDKKYNRNYGTCSERIAQKVRCGKNSKPVLQYTKDGCLLHEWGSIGEVGRILGYPHSSISGCCHGRSHTSYGYIWKFKES